MKSETWTTLRAVCCACIAAAFAACSGGGTVPQAVSRSVELPQSLSARFAPRYRLVVLGNGIAPNKINNAGVVVGQDLNTNRPFEYRAGRIADLPLLPGDTAGNAFDVNEHGQIVGQTLNPAEVGPYLSFLNPCFTLPCPQAHAVSYDRGRVSNLGSVDGFAVFNAAEVINDRGQIAGESGRVNEGGLINMAIFSPGRVRIFTDNPEFPGVGAEGIPAEINNAGELVGTNWTIFSPNLFAYPNTIACSPQLVVVNNGFDGINNAGDTISGNLESSGNYVYCRHGVGYPLNLLPAAINDRGDIVGSATAQSEVYAGNAFHAIGGSLTGTKFGHYFISRDRKLAGYVRTVSANDALLYSNGTYYDLNNLVSNGTGLVLQNPTSINNRRDIVGATVSSNSQTVGWLLIPQ